MEKYITQNGIKYELKGEQYYSATRQGIGETSDAFCSNVKKQKNFFETYCKLRENAI